jgi:hypothetical protein
MEVSEAGHEIKYLGFRRVVTGVIFLGGLDDDVDDIGETAAATAAFLHSVVHLSRYDKLPTVLLEKLVDDFPDLRVGYVVAAANKHVLIPNMTVTIVFSAKEDGDCQEKIVILPTSPFHISLSVR